MARQCTYAQTGANFKTQEWFECRTCGMCDGSGVCGPCAQVCHAGHSLSAPKTSSFYCDCGASGCAAMAAPSKGAPAPKKPSGPAKPASSSAPPPAAAPVRRAAPASSAQTMNMKPVPKTTQVRIPPPVVYRPEDLAVGADAAVVRLPPLYYLHMMDSNEGTTSVVTGPATVTRRDGERLVLGPRKFMVIPPGHYCIIADPIVRHPETGAPVVERGQFKLAFGELEVRRASEPFFLYPGESVSVGVTPLTIVPEACALRLRAQVAITDLPGGKIEAGAEWLHLGPATYVPHVAVTVVETIEAVKLEATQALRLRARNDCLDNTGVRRTSGEEWLVRGVSLYLPAVEEIVLGIVEPFVLSDTVALHLRALRTFVDVFDVPRTAGQEWLVTKAQTTEYLADVCEELVGVERAIILTNRQYCVVLDPVDTATGLPQLGRAQLRKGPAAFFLQPHERLRSGVNEVEILGAHEALLVRAIESFKDDTDGAVAAATAVAAGGRGGAAAGPAVGAKAVERCAGDRWLVEGPCEYYPPTCVEILARRAAIPLAENEGIYVRDLSGAVYSVVGESYLLKATEELYQKEMPANVEGLLVKYGGPAERDKTRLITFQVPFNSACQVYDYRVKSARVVFGPDLVSLQPDEQLTVLSLSGGKPKRSGQVRDLVLCLGPDFSTDILTVETSDHARLDVRLSYGWYFDVDRTSPKAGALLFNVPDFVGDMCKAIASRVRGAVASIPFDVFHRHSAEIINRAVFGTNADGTAKTELRFPANLLVVTAVDIQSVEPIDKSTRDSLMQSVQLAISITTDALEAAATNAAKTKEQAAMAELQRQRIRDEAAVEEARQLLIQLKAESRAVETTGTATAEAQARAQAQKIVGTSEVTLAKLRVDAADIFSAAEIQRMTAYQEAELTHQREVDSLEIDRERRQKEIEATKFRDTVNAIGRETIKTIANAGPEMQASLLAGLGLQGFVVTDGQSPLNFFNLADGITATPGQ